MAADENGTTGGEQRGTSISELVADRLQTRVGELERARQVEMIILEEVARRALAADVSLDGLGLGPEWLAARRDEGIAAGYGTNRAQKRAAAKKRAAKQ